MNVTTGGTSVREQVSDDEWRLRVDLAACYRLIAAFGWDDLVFTHISARVPGAEEHFLINAYGMLYEEMTASSLVKINFAGDIVMETPYAINPAGFTIHSAIHAARHDAGCILHTHTKAGIAVSAQVDGLRPLSQISLLPFASLTYHGYEGIALNEEEKPRLVADLGSSNFLMLRNHGLLTVGANIPDAFIFMYALETACQTQLAAQSAGVPLIEIDQKIVAGIKAQVENVTRGMGGALAWPGLLRKLERMDISYRE